MYKYSIEVVSVVLSAIILGIGVYFGLSCPDNFARSGSLVVMVAVFCAVWGAQSKYSETVLSSVFDYLIAREEVRLKFSEAVDEGVAEKSNVENATPESVISAKEKAFYDLDKSINQSAKEQLASVLAKEFKPSIITELILLLIGTFIWGFGDVLIKLFIS